MADFQLPVFEFALTESVGYFLCAVGLFTLVGALWPILRFVWVWLWVPELRGRYGKEPWAVVTGATSGLGAEFCTQLARKGYNIVLIARRETDLRQTAQLLQDTHKVQTRVIPWSAASSEESLEAHYSSLLQQVEDLDISILVNLLSITEDGFFVSQPLPLLLKTLELNIWPALLLTRWAVQKMSRRKERSAVINFSSMAMRYPYAGMSLYSATMKFVDFLSQSVMNEISLTPDLHIDVLSVRPSGIQTGTVPTSPNQVPPAVCVSAVLRNLGRSPYTAGALKHSLLTAFTSIIPEGFKAKLIVENLRKQRNTTAVVDRSSGI